MEHVGHGAGNVVGGSVDGFMTGVGYGSAKIASPYPKSIYAPGQNQMVALPAGVPIYGGQVDSETSATFLERGMDRLILSSKK